MMKKFALLFVCALFASPIFAQAEFDIQGHRGARGLMPENSIPGFLKALEYRVNTLELDVVVSQDRKIVLSHEPWFASEITLDPDGKPISAADQTIKYNLYQMKYADIKKFDVGSLGNARFPEQQKLKTYKPLLSEVFKETQKYLKKNKLSPVFYNIETKSKPEGDDKFHPTPVVFAKLLYDEITRAKMEKFVTIQSFDVRTLQEFNKFAVKLPLVLLVENKDGIEKNIEKLGFKPQIYSPHFSLLNEETVAYCRRENIKIIPWTVNENKDLEALKKFKLDGVITDYPDRAVKIFRGN